MSSTPSHPVPRSRAVLVTGASRGIGRAVALAFAAAGDRVAVHYGSRDEEARRTLEALPGDGHLLVRADLGDPEQVRAAVASAADGLGGLDVLVNNAAVYEDHDPLASSWEDWKDTWTRHLSINLLGTVHATFCAAPHLVAAAGAVVNVSSRGAFRGEPGCPAYGASKGGMNSFAQSMALALAPHGVSVTSVAPGYVATDMTYDLLDGPGGDAIRAQSGFGRVAEPEDVAAAVLWLASPQARFSSGSIVDVNGASFLRM